MKPSLITQVPVVDIAAFMGGGGAGERLAIARQVDDINRQIGFLVITGHGLPRSLLDDWFGLSRQFFEGPPSVKDAVAAAAGAHHGYHRLAQSGLAAKEGEAAPPDLREYFMVGNPLLSQVIQIPGAERFHRPNQWPATLPRFQEVALAYYAAMEDLGARLMGMFALALGLQEDWFANKIDHHFSVLSTIYYPAQEKPPLPGQLRAGAHTDYGSLTILAPNNAPGGLQVRGLDGRWLDVPYLPDGFVINIGDLMQRWSNDRWRSNLHRVVNPPRDGKQGPRQSVAYFLHPNHDALIDCIPTCRGAEMLHPVVTAGDYMWEKEHAIEGAAKE
jgi:isopenicillin N synthase-like dioxygenase